MDTLEYKDCGPYFLLTLRCRATEPDDGIFIYVSDDIRDANYAWIMPMSGSHVPVDISIIDNRFYFDLSGLPAAPALIYLYLICFRNDTV